MLFVFLLAAQLQGVYLDPQGVIRSHGDWKEVSLFGANYIIHTASDYRAAGYVHGDRKKMIDEDMAQFARMGWDGLRLTFWGDWEASDSAGNLIANDHLDLLDYLIARAKERGISLLLSPIQLYSSNWPDALEKDSTTPGFGRVFGKARMGTDPAAIAAQVNYLRQLLNHKNPYTRVALKNEPAILFIELVNEPWHHPEDVSGSIRYINRLTEAVRSTGCEKLIFYNVSQDFRIAGAIRSSLAQGVTFGWYPTGLNAGYELQGNYLRGADAFPAMLDQQLNGLPRIVYEFDSPDTRNATMYPAMARTFRSVGAQFAAMFAYDMLGTASRNLGWQTHYLNLVYTPRKAVSAMIAAEAMRRVPRMQRVEPYPGNLKFGDFSIAPDSDVSVLAAADAFLNAGSTRIPPPSQKDLKRVAGYGSSPIVAYGGEGTYFLDKLRPGIWRLEVYPDAVPVTDPFEPPRPDKIVTRAIHRSWPMTITLADLGATFSVQPVTAGTPQPATAAAGRFDVRPGVYILSARGPVEIGKLPKQVGKLRIAEYHAPPTDSLPPSVETLAAAQYLSGRDAEVRARVVSTMPSDSVTLSYLPANAGSSRVVLMRPVAGYVYSATIPAAALTPGQHELVITAGQAADSSKVEVVDPASPLQLFNPLRDRARLAFTRIGDAGRRGLYRMVGSAFHFALPRDTTGWSPEDYTTSLVVKDRVSARQETIANAKELRLRVRGLGAEQLLIIRLMEDDGTTWTARVTMDSTWSEQSVPLASFRIGRGVLLPQGFPGEWNYWVQPATGRGEGTDHLRLDHLERLQMSLRRDGGPGVEVEWVALGF